MAPRSSTEQRILVGILLAAALVAGARPASAEDAEALIQRGVELRQQGKDEPALELFRRALAESPTPRARAQVALAEQALGMWALAERDLVAALAAEGDPWIQKNKAALERALGVVREHLGDLEVRGGPAGAEVFVDGARVATLPMTAPARVVTGVHAVEVRAPGHVAVTRTATVTAGGVARETVELARAAVVGPSPGEPRGTTPGGAAPAGSSGPSGLQIAGYAGVGLGVVGVGLGVTGLLLRQSAVSDYNAQCPGVGAAQSPDCADKIATGDRWRTIAIASFVGGGIVGLGGGALLLFAPRAPNASAIACGPAGASLACQGRF